MHQFSKGQYVFVVSNRFWFHYVYIFSLLIKCFQFILFCCYPNRFRYWEFNHVLRSSDGTLTEMTDKGKRTGESLSEWAAKQRRTVLVYRALQPFKETHTKPYDFFGIPQLVLHYLRKLVFKIGNSWNGTDGIPKGRDGYFCSEEVAQALGHEKPHLVLPCQIPDLDKLEYVGTFRT